MSTPEDFAQLALRFTDSIQFRYEVIRDIMLADATIVERSRVTGVDRGTVATHARRFVEDGMLEELDIANEHIARGKPWENLIESQFKVELRLADAHFERATTLEEIQERHAAFIETFNETPHWAHQQRADGLRTPVAVLGWVRGREVDLGQLAQAVRHLQLERVVNRRGYVSVRRFYLYAERGLARRRVSVWLYDGRLQLAYQDTILAQYTYRAERRARRLQAVESPQHYPTRYASPQLELWELDDEQWHKILPRPYDRRPRRIVTGAWQLPLLARQRSRRSRRSIG